MTSNARHLSTDVLIIGGGSAGSIAADKISEISACDVTVCETGLGWEDGIDTYTSNAFALPIDPESLVATRYTSQLTDEPPQFHELIRGRCIGGSGAINGGYFCPAPASDFPWMEGWSWEDVVPHYRSILDRMNVTSAVATAEATHAFAQAISAHDYRWVDDLATQQVGGSQPPGFGPVPVNITDGRRMSPAEVYLRSAGTRTNVRIRARTRAVELRWAGDRVVGATVVSENGLSNIDADIVVLAAGAIETAALLMRSGVGPALDLEAQGIRVRHDLPVGMNVRDHPEWLIPTSWGSTDDCPLLESVALIDAWELRPYTRAFAPLLEGRRSRMDDRTHLGVAVMQPESSGRVMVTSSDPTSPVTIEHHYDADEQSLRTGAKLAQDIFGKELKDEAPIRATSQHLCSTAPMGTDGQAVVNAQGQVRGCGGLYVADGSVLPHVPSRGPHATIAMVAQRIAAGIAAQFA